MVHPVRHRFSRLAVVSSLTAIALASMGGCGPHVIRAPESEASDGLRAERAEQVRIRRLLVAYAGAQGASATLTRTREEAQQRAAMLAGMARGGDQSFRELVTQYGDTPPDTDDRSRQRIIIRGQNSLSEVEEEAALRLRVRQVTRPLLTTAGYVIIVREPDPAQEDQGPTEIGARHILIQFEGASRAAPGVTRSRDEALALAHQIAASAAEEGADWVALHREYSDEQNSPEGGDLGVFGHGQMVRAFDRAAFRLDVGEVSEPVESEFGFHIIQRTR